MKRTFFILFALILGVHAADRPLGRMPNGSQYVKDEMDFCLKADAARALSPTGASRQPLAQSRLLALNPDIVAVIGNNLSASNWLNGQPLPAALQHTGTEVPEIARSLTATTAP